MGKWERLTHANSEAHDQSLRVEVSGSDSGNTHVPRWACWRTVLHPTQSLCFSRSWLRLKIGIFNESSQKMLLLLLLWESHSENHCSRRILRVRHTDLCLLNTSSKFIWVFEVLVTYHQGCLFFLFLIHVLSCFITQLSTSPCSTPAICFSQWFSTRGSVAPFPLRALCIVFLKLFFGCLSELCRERLGMLLVLSG